MHFGPDSLSTAVDLHVAGLNMSVTQVTRLIELWHGWQPSSLVGLSRSFVDLMVFLQMPAVGYVPGSMNAQYMTRVVPILSI